MIQEQIQAWNIKLIPVNKLMKLNLNMPIMINYYLKIY